MIDVPYNQLSPEALLSVLEEFATRDGTEFTATETKIGQLRKLLEAGELKIWFDPDSESCQIVNAREQLPPS